MIECVLTLRKIQIFSLLVGITLIVTAYVPGFSKYAEASKGDNNITNQLGGKNDTDFKEKNAIKICCAWSDKLADGVLSYNMIGRGNKEVRQAVRDAIHEWDTAIQGLEFTEISGKNTPADIELKFTKGGGQVAGKTVTGLDNNRFIDNVKITISKTAFGNTFNAQLVKQITKHEMGHALGLAHANFQGNLMTAKINDEASDISECEINAVQETNRWKLLDNQNNPRTPDHNYVIC
jgi:predicted Zn-dependent protease